MTIRILLPLVLIAYSNIGWCQKTAVITNQNYYSYSPTGGKVDFLRVSDAVPVIIDELIKRGISNYEIGVGGLMKINDSTPLVVTITFEKSGKKYGILYEEGHGIPIDAKDRDFFNEKTHSYRQSEYDTKGKVHFFRVNPLPQNIFLLRETCYWFQPDPKYPVSKTVACNILRQDVDEYFKNL